MHIQRRDFLSGGAAAFGGALLASRMAFASANTGEASRLVFVILRGALDGLAAVPPYGDPNYRALRGDLAFGAPGTPGGALRLDATFGLHPSLAFMQQCFAAREAIVFHAVASPYRERSHFDGQDVLENGFGSARASQTGWLNRALTSMPAPGGSPKEMGVALGQNLPLVIRGPAAVTSWSPSRLAGPDEDTLARITDLYSNDPVLSRRLAEGLAAYSLAAADVDEAVPAPGKKGDNKRNARYVETVRLAAAFLRRDDGPRVAVFDTTGWDTHANEGAASGQLASRLGALDASLGVLKAELGPIWQRTAVLLATEFGRTAAVNGTRGTDHGTGAAAFLLGGAVKGGRVIADWPGLAQRDLHQARDLRPTLDLRSIFKGVLSEHLRITDAALSNEVFPQSAAARSLSGLTRT